LYARPNENAWWLFDEDGRLTEVSDFITDAPRALLAYAGGQLSSFGVWDGPTLRQTTISRAGANVTITPPWGRATTVVVDPVSHRLLSVNQADGRTATFEYGDDGLLRSYTDADGIVHMFRYDRRGRLRFDESSTGMRLQLQYFDSVERGEWSWVYAIRNTGRWWTVGRRERFRDSIDNCNESEEYQSLADAVPGYCRDRMTTEILSADSSGAVVRRDAIVHFPQYRNGNGSGGVGGYSRVISPSGAIGTKAPGGASVVHEHRYRQGGTVIESWTDGLVRKSCFALRPGRFTTGAEPGTAWQACDVTVGASTVAVARLQLSLDLELFQSPFGGMLQLFSGIDRVVQWQPSSGGWTMTVSDGDGPSSTIELDAHLRVTSFETRDDDVVAPRSSTHIEYATASASRSWRAVVESVDGDLGDLVRTGSTTFSSDGTTNSRTSVSAAANGESTRSTLTVEPESWSRSMELRDGSEAVIAQMQLEGITGANGWTLDTYSGASHDFVVDPASLTSAWVLPASDRCDTHDDCVPAECDLVCLAAAMCINGTCSNGAIRPVITRTTDVDGALISTSLPGHAVVTLSYAAETCFPEGGSCTVDSQCVEGGQCLETVGTTPSAVVVSGDGERDEEIWTYSTVFPESDQPNGTQLQSRSPDAIASVVTDTPNSRSVTTAWSDVALPESATGVAGLVDFRAPNGMLARRTLTAAGGGVAQLTATTSTDGREIAIDATRVEVRAVQSLGESIAATVAVTSLVPATAGQGVFESRAADDFGRLTRRVYARAPVTTAPEDCAEFMAAAEGSGIYCEELEYDLNGRIVAHTTRINESADAEPPAIEAWAYTYTPGDGRLASATLNGTQGAEYAWSANGTLAAMVRDLGALPFRAVGGTNVEIDEQDRLWRFGDIRYGYTPDGRATWRRERQSDGTERLLCLDYDVFSGLRGAQWITEGSGEELGCDEVEEFDGGVAYQLDSGGRRIVTDRTVGGVTAATN
jgi:YD repeat-containing protein